MIFVVLPAYNEESSIGSLLESLDDVMNEAQVKYKAVIVNDGSSDGTLKLVQSLSERMPIEVINHSENKGLGEAIKSGLIGSLADCDNRDIIITMDADNSHAPGLILRMVRMIREGNDVVIASRYRQGSRMKGVPLFRLVLSKSAGILFRIFFPTPGVKDFTCGYRAYKAEVLRKAFAVYGNDFIKQSGFSCMVDILLKLRELDVIMNEAPLILRYDFKHSMSKMKIRKTIKETLALLLSRRFKGIIYLVRRVFHA